MKLVLWIFKKMWPDLWPHLNDAYCLGPVEHFVSSNPSRGTSSLFFLLPCVGGGPMYGRTSDQGFLLNIDLIIISELNSNGTGRAFNLCILNNFYELQLTSQWMITLIRIRWTRRFWMSRDFYFFCASKENCDNQSRVEIPQNSTQRRPKF
jgi:hypothetical protein